MKKCCEEKHAESLLIGEGKKKHYVLMNDISIDSCMIIHCIAAFTTEEVLKRHIKDSFKINGKETINMPKKGEYVKFKNFERKRKSPLVIYADFESILAPEDNGKQNPNINKYQKQISLTNTSKYQKLLLVYIKKTISKSLKSIYS